MPRDYYEVLGVSRTATADEIRKAHRRLARKYHPDVSKAPDSTKKFAEVQEAYDVLGDADKRKLYDQFGHAGVHGHPGAAPGGAAEAGPFGAGGPFRQGPFRTTWSSGDASGWSDDAEAFDSVFGDLFGSRRGRAGGRSTRPTPQEGDDIEHTVSIPFTVAASGGTESLRMTRADGTSQQLDVKIPAGINSGAKMRIKGKGQTGRSGGPPGDLILIVHVAEHPWFRRDGLDLYLDVPITIVEAALGAVLEVPLLKGSVKLRVPAGTSSGAKLRAKGKGIADAKGETGDFYAVVRVVAPEKLSDADRAMLEKLGATLPNPRAETPWAGEVQRT
ncbi:MAG: DnaJ C-terminal domain-containing protein [Phycisphaerales bacterium]